MRRRIKHRAAITISVIIPGVLLTLAFMGLSSRFNGLSGPVIIPPVSSGPSGTVHTLAKQLNIGVYKPAVKPTLTSVQNFGITVGHKPDLLLVYSVWRTQFRRGIAWRAYKRGMTVIDQIEPWGKDGNGISLESIVRGKYDPYLERFATSVRDFGHNVIIGFGHEMNGIWYPWSKYPPPVFVAAWQHIVGVFRAEDANNVTWMWTIHHAASGILPYWPGSKYVDMVGIDGYFETPKNTFQKIFGVAINAVRKIAKKIPIMIGETAVGPDTHHEARDVRSIFAGIDSYHLYGMVWFDHAQHNGKRHQNWDLANPKNRAALDAFKAEIQHYTAKQSKAKLASGS
jgi:hypothetical protein